MIEWQLPRSTRRGWDVPYATNRNGCLHQITGHPQWCFGPVLIAMAARSLPIGRNSDREPLTDVRCVTTCFCNVAGVERPTGFGEINPTSRHRHVETIDRLADNLSFYNSSSEFSERSKTAVTIQQEARASDVLGRFAAA